MRIQCWIAMLACAGGSAVAAPWSPQWTAWQSDADARVSPVDVMVAPDGTLFAGGELSSAGATHPMLLRFEGDDGRLAWTRDLGAVYQDAGFEWLSGGRIAMLGSPEALPHDSFVEVLDAIDGSPLWRAESSLGTLPFADFAQTLLVEGTDGVLHLLLRSPDRTEAVVRRLSPTGDELPPWRRGVFERVRPDAIAALPGSGGVAVLSSVADGPGPDRGFAATRFGSDGTVQSEWQESGDGDYVTSLGRLAADMAGDLLAVANFAVEQGDHRATVWKVDAGGRRSWRSFLDDPRSGRPRFARRFVPAANGDALVVVARDEPATSPPWPHRLVRVAGGDGRVLWEADLPFSLDDSGPHWQLPKAVAEAPNGRILAVGWVVGSPLPRMVEFTADGAPCRRHDDEVGGIYTHAAGTAHGWSVLGRTSARLLAQRFDATGACDGVAADELVFRDGFDAVAARRGSP